MTNTTRTLTLRCAILAAISTGALSLLTLSNSTIETIKAQSEVTRGNQPPVINAQFSVCDEATGSCANCHYFIPNHPAGCRGLMITKRPKPGTVNPHTGKPAAPSKEPSQQESHVWQSHPGAGPIDSPVNGPVSANYINHDIPLPTCFPCSPKSGTVEVADFPLPTCFPCPSDPGPGPGQPSPPPVPCPAAGYPWCVPPCTDASCTGNGDPVMTGLLLMLAQAQSDDIPNIPMEPILIFPPPLRA